jgi:hypothetical protein
MGENGGVGCWWIFNDPKQGDSLVEKISTIIENFLGLGE